MNRDLFEGVESRTLRRNTDPTTSHRGAEEVTRSGRAAAHREQILGLISRHPGRDVNGILEAAKSAGLTHLDRAAISKRLPELHRNGLIYTGSESGRARRWFATKGKA